MIERVIENWLTNVNELGYQIPFCHVLTSIGYEIIHISRHGRGEHGKDIVARNPHGALETFQLKGGDINLSAWREIRGEVEDLVRLPIKHPSIADGEPHTPYLVTNGVLVGDAADNIRYFAEEWEQRGSPRLDVISKDQLHRRFLDAHAEVLPKEMGDFREFIELYVTNHKDKLDRPKLARFMMDVAETYALDGRRTTTRRAINSIALLGAYILEQYERNENWVSAAEGWTIVAATILFIAEAQQLAVKDYEGTLDLLALALKHNLQSLEEEVARRTDFSESRFVLAEPLVHGTRTATTLGWLCASALRKALVGESVDYKFYNGVLKRHFPHVLFIGECDWPKALSITLYLDRFVSGREADWLLEVWVTLVRQNNRRSEGNGFASPYWLEDRILKFMAGELPPFEVENFTGNSYTTMCAMDGLVRRLCRQKVAAAWPSVSKIHFCQFLPPKLEDTFRWHCKTGATEISDPVPTASWSAWRDAVADLEMDAVPVGFRRHPEWLLPLILTYPHRANRHISKLADAIHGLRVNCR